MTSLSDIFSTSRVSRAALWRTYALALLALVAVISASHLLAEWMAREQTEDARIINLAGKQRMLSQRIAGQLVEAAKTDTVRLGFVGRIHDDLNLMADTHDRLTGRTADRVEATLSAQVRHLYFQGEPSVDARVRTFLAEARTLTERIAAGEAIDPDRLDRFAGAARGRLLAALDRVVTQYQNDAEDRLDRLRILNALLYLVALAVILVELLVIFRPLTRRLDRAQRDLEALAHTDPLTGCWNRRSLMEGGAMLLALARRQERPFAVVLVDIDRFKQVNDTYGHGAGDAVIRAFAARTLECLREQDVLGRYGGEEFVIVLPDTGLEAASRAAERIRRHIEATPVRTEGEALSVTASFGVAARAPGDEALQAIIERADLGLYAAKQGGRNRVAVKEADAPVPDLEPERRVSAR